MGDARAHNIEQDLEGGLGPRTNVGVGVNIDPSGEEPSSSLSSSLSSSFSSSSSSSSPSSSSSSSSSSASFNGHVADDFTSHRRLSPLRKWNKAIESLSGFEARGIARVPPEERQAPSRWNDSAVALLWFSANISANNLTVGLFGPLVFGLGFADSAICAVGGALLGSLSTAYMSVWGPQSGNRTMVVVRFFMGYWPAKIPAFLNIVLMVGYCTIDAILAGQILSAVNGADLSISVGIIIVQLVCWVVGVFGINFFHHYERFAWIPQLLVIVLLIGAAAPSFDASLQSTGSPSFVSANRLSFLSLCLYVPNSWGAAASDFYVYYPERTSRPQIFCLTLAGLWLAFSLVYLVGIGFATGLVSTTAPAWSDSYATSTGALLVAGFAPLGYFGRFCSVIVALGVTANSIPGTYSAALGCQVLGRYGQMVPRWVWSCVLVLLELILALAGREHLLVIMQNFLSLMGYWIEFMVAIVLIEHLWFRRGTGELDWGMWNNKDYLPVGVAALGAFAMGWVGAVLGMFQIWYTGPLATVSGPADVGMWVGSGLAAVAYVPLRYLELKMVGR